MQQPGQVPGEPGGMPNSIQSRFGIVIQVTAIVPVVKSLKRPGEVKDIGECEIEPFRTCWRNDARVASQNNLPYLIGC